MKSRNIFIHNVRSRKAFTLVEMLIALGMIAFIAAMGLWASMDVYRGYSYRSEVKTLVSTLQKARLASMINVNGAPHGVHIASNQYTIFQGVDYASRDTTFDTVITPSPSVTITSADVVFEQLSGDASNQTITISNGARSNDIVINDEGQINY